MEILWGIVVDAPKNFGSLVKERKFGMERESSGIWAEFSVRFL